MNEHVTASEIADLMRRIHVLHNQPPPDPVEQADILAIKAELLARIADQRAEWALATTAPEPATSPRKPSPSQPTPTDSSGSTGQVAPNSQENPPPF